jgi:hypothetical protein
MPTFAVLGLGARAVDFRGREWPFRGGRMGWIRWLDPQVYPTTVDGPPDTPEDPDSEQRMGYALSAGRFTVTTDLDGNDGAVLAAAVADAMTGIVALHNVPAGVKCSITAELEQRG